MEIRTKMRPVHRAQLEVYFLLIEEAYRVKPPYGVVVTGDGQRHRIENDANLRAWVLDLAQRIRGAGAELLAPISVEPNPGQCRPCGMRDQCGQARPEAIPSL